MALTALARIGTCEDEIPCLDCFYYQHVQVRVWLGNQPHPMRKYKANPYQRNNFGRTPYEMRDGLFLRKSIYEDLLQSLAGSCDSTPDRHFGGIQAMHCRAVDLVNVHRDVSCVSIRRKRGRVPNLSGPVLRYRLPLAPPSYKSYKGFQDVLRPQLYRTRSILQCGNSSFPQDGGSMWHHTTLIGRACLVACLQKILLQFPMKSKAVFHCTLDMIHSAALDQDGHHSVLLDYERKRQGHTDSNIVSSSIRRSTCPHS